MRHPEANPSEAIAFGQQNVTIEAVEAIASGAGACLSQDQDFRRRIDRGVAFLDRLLREDGVVYGVTTGYGDSCTRRVAPEHVAELPLHLTRFHGCGLGRHFDAETTRAIIAARLASLARGRSGVRYQLLERLCMMLEHDLLPWIPEEGSVGASGDLTPLSYVAAALVGERQVRFGEQSESLPAREAWQRLALEPLQLRPKEGLAIMNGTAVMTALACRNFVRADYLARLASRITAMSCLALKGNAFHFEQRLFDAKPHPGQAQVASWISADLEHERLPRNPSRLQDQYSLRCAPHVIGVLQDAAPMMRQMIETELNSSNDNPIIDVEDEGSGSGYVLHGGHFYGGHIAFAMDSMKQCVANIADLLDRQMALLMDPRFNRGLPANLSGATPSRASLNHGFKALQIGCSAWAAEALKLTMPASVFSRSTECHNQDKVSMGTIASRDCQRVLELTEQVAVSVLLASAQGISLRCQSEPETAQHTTESLTAMVTELRQHVDLVEEDRPLESELRHMLELVRSRHFSLYDN